jgi:Sulfotransferase family
MRMTDGTLGILDLALRHPLSMGAGLLHRAAYRDVGAYAMFIGTPHCGQSLIGSLIDAHPNALIAHELGALKYLTARYSRIQIYELIRWNSRRFAARGRVWHDYPYEVAGQWQGCFMRIDVIGDKQGSGAVLRLAARPRLLDRLRRTVGGRLRVLHVVRNPYDAISTLAYRTGQDLDEAVAFHSSHLPTIATVREALAPGELLEFRHEEFVAAPREVLGRVCAFLGLEPSDAYLDACTAIVFEKPRRTRQTAPWNPALVETVRDAMSSHEFLRGYEFEVPA